MARKRIPDRTKLAAELLERGEIPYEHAKLMGETNFLSLYQLDHNIYHESGHPDRDEFWNLKHRLIAEHREKTKRDAKIIAKGRRIRKRLAKPFKVDGILYDKATGTQYYFGKPRKIPSRPFDKRLKRKVNGTVVQR